MAPLTDLPPTVRAYVAYLEQTIGDLERRVADIRQTRDALRKQVADRQGRRGRKRDLLPRPPERRRDEPDKDDELHQRGMY